VPQVLVDTFHTSPLPRGLRRTSTLAQIAEATGLSIKTIWKASRAERVGHSGNGCNDPGDRHHPDPAESSLKGARPGWSASGPESYTM
jgi:hypothetical protein